MTGEQGHERVVVNELGVTRETLCPLYSGTRFTDVRVGGMMEDGNVNLPLRL